MDVPVQPVQPGGEHHASVGFVYEPLEFINILQTNPDGTPKVTPWLATGSTWSPDFTTLTMTIRSGAKWSDGSPFSANDVVYTFNALKADPALDLNALWSVDSGPLTSVTLQGTDQVVFTFNAPAQSYFYYVADQTPIIPQHIWSTLDQTKLDAQADTNPVGTGPYLMTTCSQDNIKYLRNTSYWQSKPGHPVPQVAEVDYPAFLSNTSANLYLAQGQAQWGAQYIPNIQSYYISKSPSTRHYWFPPTLNVSLFPNLDNPLLSILAVRQAISLAIDRAQVLECVQRCRVDIAECREDCLGFVPGDHPRDDEVDGQRRPERDGEQTDATSDVSHCRAGRALTQRIGFTPSSPDRDG